ncbi:MAG TPA: F420-dependent oxidoreductase, partial [Actinomycetota bacterium]|nr:F420-dependent oxidoreductase [Actinomycetota bacterium]
RDIGELEMVGGTRGRFAGPKGVADLGEALASIPPQLERGFTTICIKPSQFVDDPNRIGAFCREVVERVEALLD